MKICNNMLQIWNIREIYLSLQQNIKAPPFFLEWTWPSEDGFFYARQRGSAAARHLDFCIVQSEAYISI